MLTPASTLRGSLRKCQGQGWVCTVCPATSRGQLFFPNLKAALNHERTAHVHEPSEVENDKRASCVDDAHFPNNPLRTADETCWDKIGHLPLTSEGLRQWEMHAHVDHVYDLVPFWQRGIDAAERGEVLRLEEFLDKMEGDGGWRTAHEVLGMLGGCQWKTSRSKQAHTHGGWGEPCQGNWTASQRGTREPNAFGWGGSQRGGWGAASTHIASDATESSCGRDSGRGTREEWVRPDFKMGGPQDGCGIRSRGKAVRAVRGDGGREELRHFVDAIARQEAVNEERRRQMHSFFEMSIEQKIQKIQETIRFLHTHA